MKNVTLPILCSCLGLVPLSAAQPADHLVFDGKGGIGNGKHIVFLAGDEEYRSEEAMPMMAELMSKHGFKCTVLFSLDKDGKFVAPANQASLSHPSALDSADAIVMSLRFRNWDDNAMGKFQAAFERGVPLTALRTSTHAFNFKKGSKWEKYSWRAPKSLGWDRGFGRQVLGETWVNHHGRHKVEGARSVVEQANAKNPILNGVGTIFAESDVYGAKPKAVSNILLRGMVTETLKPRSPGVKSKNKHMQPVAWTREFKQANGKSNKVFTTTMGAASDLDDTNLRRLVANGILWGLDIQIPGKLDVAIPNTYVPTFYGFNTYRKNKVPADFVLGQTVSAITHKAAVANKAPAQLEMKPNSRIGFIGGGLGSRMNIFNHFETELQTRYPQHNLYIRNFCKEGDTPGFRPHPSRNSHYSFPGAKALVKKEYQRGGGNGHYETPDQWLQRHEIDTVIGFFGYSESFDGLNRIEGYKAELRAFIKHSLKQNYSGQQIQLAIVSPIAFEDLSAQKDLPNGVEENKRLAAYTKAMQEVCAEEGVICFDAYSASSDLYKASSENLTSNAHNLNDAGYRKFSPVLADGLFGKKEKAADYASVHKAVAEKNRLWLLDYKIPNGVHVHGRRYKPFGNHNYPAELYKTREMTKIRDLGIWAANKGKKFDPTERDSLTIPLKKMKTNYKPSKKNGPTKYLTGKEVEKTLKLPEGYKMELFADETMFPDLANPSQMSFDNKGRLWVGCMGSYPHYRIGDPLPKDKIIIFEDTDGDGKADKQTNFAEDIHIPMGFEIAPEGVYVSLGNNLVLLKDTDGDDKYDTKEAVISGFDDHDTHHAISAFCADPSGAIYMGEGVFSHSNVETPYGPVRGTNGGFYRFNPAKGRLERTAQLGIPNPWGIAFDKWGQNFFLHTSGSAFAWMQRSAIKPRYAVNLSAPNLLTSNNVRPTSGLEFVSSSHFPDDVQGDVLLCNNIGFLGAKQHRVIQKKGQAGYTTQFRQDLFKTSHGNFRPVDLEFAPDGSLYVVDWHNVLIGHMQHNARDPLRDHVHGRIYRITYPSRPLVKPAKIDGASIEVLLDNLKLHEYRSRYRTRRELRGRDANKVATALTKWVAGLDPKDPEYTHQLLEGLWVSWGINKIDVSLLEKLLASKDFRARSAATRAVRYNADKLPKAADYLMASAQDEHPQVRHEAAIAATWMDTATGLKVIATVEKSKVDNDTKDAIKWGKANLAHLDPVKTPEPKVKYPAHLKNSKDKELLSLYAKGEKLYNHGENCASCHQKHGNGIPKTFPPLNGSKWVTEHNGKLLTQVALHGIMGKIKVKGKEFNGAMPGYAFRTKNKDIAAMLTYVSNAWGNTTGRKITEKDVADLLEKTEKGPFMPQGDVLLKKFPLKN